MLPDPMSSPDAERQRLQALLDYAVLDTPAEPGFDDITRLAAQFFETPVALVSLIDRDRQWFKSRVGMTTTQTPRAIAFCDFAIRSLDVMVVPHAAADARFERNPLVTGEAGVRFYAGAPLVTPEGHAVGTLCVIDRRPRHFDDTQRAALAALSRQVVAQLELGRKNAVLEGTVASLRTEGEHLQRLQARLETSEARMGLVLKGTNDGWWDWDLVTGQRYYSPRGWAMLGYEDQELPYDERLWDCLIHADDGPLVLRTFKDAIRSGAEHCTVELRLRHKGGHFIPALSRGYILRNAEGRAIRFSGTNTDLSEMRRAEQERLEIQGNYEALWANSIDGVLQTHPGGGVLSANPAACAMLGRTEAEICALGRDQLLDLTDARLPALLAERERTGRARGELRMIRAGGERFEVEMSSALYRDRHGQLRASAVFRDITERRIWARRLEDSLALLDNLAQRVPGVIYQYRLYPDGRACFPFASQGIWDIYEVTPEEVRESSKLVFQRLHPEDAPAVAEAIRVSAAALQPWRQEYRVILPAQGERWRQGEAQPELLADGSVLWHGFITDITDRKRAEAHTHRLAHFDALTGLPNRRLLIERIEQALAAARRSENFGALLFVDLDNFKQINDARGHSVGDRLLEMVAERLSRELRGDDAVARLGGDEFVVLIGNLGADADAAARRARAVADKLREGLESPYEIEGSTYGSSGSIGITLFPKNGERVDDLLREADIAMYRAKAAGRNRIAFFESVMHAEVESRLALEQDLKQAIAAGRIDVHLQSQFDAARREVGAELLLRWNDPVRGDVPPAQFIPVAEESGLILALGETVLRRACEALVRLRAAGVTMPLSVNVSPRQFRKDDFVDSIRALLAQTGAPASGLILEVTEGLLIENWEATQARMSELVALGVRFSIDDFGTGYSSLGYLKKLPLYELKIDRSFVRDTPDDPSDTAIVQSILSVARHLGLRVVAEGVETRAQAEFLIANDCECLQGFLFARPRPLAEWLAQRLPTAAVA
jgi:diguanylate cyclase (GGDEF)-like protein/PAS domain S-box-containing protein